MRSTVLLWVTVRARELRKLEHGGAGLRDGRGGTRGGAVQRSSWELGLCTGWAPWFVGDSLVVDWRCRAIGLGRCGSSSAEGAAQLWLLRGLDVGAHDKGLGSG